ncbi:peroxisome assembly factor 2 [Cotesia glomerata]|uniref:peroxisome assembly factor 2 n=1 Tax=Cotesia glomerata TaxID=32391 RepID=UPI001D0330F4|nr:peroxisome assembly factor 2 [Cotesia glomerata]
MSSKNFNYCKILSYLIRTLKSKKNYYLLSYVYLHYVKIKLQRLKRVKVEIETINDSNFKSIVKKYYCENKKYIDYTSCAIGAVNCFKSSETIWINICSKKCDKKYKILVLPLNVKNKLYLSETTLFNIKNVLGENLSPFIIPACKNKIEWADEVKVSLLPCQECSDDLVDNLLKNYFSNPRYLRTKDIIKINIIEHTKEHFFTLENRQLTDLFFKVNSVKINNEYTYRSCYVFCEKSTLIQETKVRGYLPEFKKLEMIDDSITDVLEEIERNSMSNFPLLSYKPFEELKSSILPFKMTENWRGMKPVFLLKGPAGSGKLRLIRALSQQMGFNFLDFNCDETQTLSVSQIETKLRTNLTYAQNLVPCILKLSNINVFGRDTEGNIDERVTPNFAEQINDIYNIKMKYPLIIIATSEDDEIPSEINRNFIETFSINYFTQDQRSELIEWFLKNRNIKYDVDLSKIAGMCSNFFMNDLETLILDAATNCYKPLMSNEKSCVVINENDFIKAYDHMQATFSEQIGAPKVPQVYWEDIGGLANLKSEIMKRIEIPLMQDCDIKRSGILFYGPPGTGKTLLAKAVATEYKLNFLSVKGPELLNMYVGQSEKNVREIFELARTASPCIIFFDELDALAPNRGRSGDSGGVMDRVVSQLLAEMDGLGSSADTFIIGATNRPDLIDSALLRPGRFDKLFYVGIYSDSESQFTVLKAITRKFNMTNADQNLDKLVKLLPANLTGADLNSLCSNAWLNAVRKVVRNYEKSLDQKQDKKKPEGNVNVSLDDFLEAVKSLVPSVSREELMRYEKLHQELGSKICK